MYAGDGYLGKVEATLGGHPEHVDSLVVRVRHWYRTRRPLIPARRVVECEPLDGLIVVTGTRRELRLLPERAEADQSPVLESPDPSPHGWLSESRIAAASIVLLCMGVAASVSLAVESEWSLLPWALVACAIALGGGLAWLAAREPAGSGDSRAQDARGFEGGAPRKKTD